MKGTQVFGAVWMIGIALLVCAPPAASQDGGPKATLPFKPLYELSYPKLEGLSKDFKVETSFVVTAFGKPLPPEDLEVHLDVGGRRIPVAVSKRGAMRLPDKKEWAKEGAFITTNQPKGALSLSFELNFSGGLDMPKKENLRYGDLMRVVNFATGIMRSASDLTGQKFDDSNMMIEYQVKDFKDQKPVATVHAKKGKIEYPADDNGLILIPYLSALFAENPKVDIPLGKLSFSYGDPIGKPESPVADPVADEDV